MRKLTLAGAIILILFAVLAAMAALGPLEFGGGKAGLYHTLQNFIDSAFVSKLGRAGASALIFALGLALAMALRKTMMPPAGGGEAPIQKLMPRRKPDPVSEEAKAEAEATASRRIAAMRDRTSAEPERVAEPGPVLVLRRRREAADDWSGARSWFGGLPRLGGQAWPKGKESGLPLPFAAQIDLADLAAIRPDSSLPKAGSVAFFVGDGAAVYVPNAADGSRHARFPIAPSTLAVRDGDEPFPEQPTPEAARTWPYWPVQIMPLDLPEHLQDHRNELAAEAIAEAMQEGAHKAASPREGLFSADDVCAKLGLDTVPLWWHSVQLFTQQLRRAYYRSQGTLGDAHGEMQTLGVAVDAMETFAEGKDEWAELSSAERADFVTMFGEISEHCATVVRGTVSPGVEDLASETMIAMFTGPAEAFSALPTGAADHINEHCRQPLADIQQMFGLGACVHDAVWTHIKDVLLLQLCSDDMMHWDFGTNGVFQFWINPADLAEGWLDRAELTFECA